MAWISSNTPPPDDQLVIVPGGVGFRRDGVWRTVTGEAWPGRKIEWEVLWWMPLPPPPTTAVPT